MRRLLLLSATAALVIARPAETVSISPVFEQGDMSFVRVENHHTSPITGLLIQATLAENGKTRMEISKVVDVYVNAFHDKAIIPGESRLIQLMTQELGRKFSHTVVVAGVLFQDGMRFGSDRGVRILIGRRQAVGRAIAQFRANLLSRKGEELGPLIATVDSLAEQQKEEAKWVPREDIAMLLAGSQVASWVKSAFSSAPAGCSPECVSRRMDFVLRGLDVWGGQIDKGIGEPSIQ